MTDTVHVSNMNFFVLTRENLTWMLIQMFCDGTHLRIYVYKIIILWQTENQSGFLALGLIEKNMYSNSLHTVYLELKLT